MSALTYKTRADGSPQGKPRVYFCAHPDDFPRYLEGICGDILKSQNCAVWYKSDPKSALSAGEYETELSQMQLLVAPITRTFLEDDGAYLQEYLFALENRIPVLPIFMADGLEDAFNRRCDGRQALYRYANSLEAQPYEEKLAAFLSSVLVGDELQKKIRAAFDGRIFISYCKEDKRYAQELMRLIHKNDCCRDVAVWYDEFLTIGGKFYGEIEEALLNSDLVAFVVTPIFAVGDNYVASTEYPLAKRVGKKLLPVELVETDKPSLLAHFDGFPETVNAYDESGMAERLKAFSQTVTKADGKETIEHDYLIGLAYLTGTDVEIDHKRAVKLITRCAEAGYDEAIEKLASMYRKGEGVTRKPDKAADWLRKLTKKRLEAYQAETSPNLQETRLLAYAEAAQTLAECVLETNQTRQMRTARSIYKALTEEIRSFLKGAESVLLQRVLVECSLMIALSIYEEEQRRKVSAYGKTAEIFGLTSGVTAWREEDIWANNRKVQEAYALLEDCLSGAEALANKTGAAADKRNLLRVYAELSGVACQVDTEKQKTYGAKSMELATSLWEETGDFQYLVKEAESYLMLAAAEEEESAIVEYVRRALACAERAVAGEAHITHRKLLYTALWTLAMVTEGEEKCALLERAAEVSAPFWEETRKNDDLNCVAGVYLALVEAEGLSDDKRREYLAKALETYKKMRSFDDAYASLYQAIINQLQPLLDAWV